MAQLAALVGYEPSPGVAANTELAFTIDPSSGAFGPALTGAGNGQVVPAASQSVTIPVGTRVQSVPVNPTQLPQPFRNFGRYSGAAPRGMPSRRSWRSRSRSLQSGNQVTTLHLHRKRCDEPEAGRYDSDLSANNAATESFTSLRTVKKVTVLGRREDHAGRSRRSAAHAGNAPPTAASDQAKPGTVSDITVTTTLNAGAVINQS